MRTCKRCGTCIDHLHHNCIRCTNCQKDYRRITIAAAVRKHRKCRGKKWFYTHKLGTSDLGEHRRDSFSEEHEIIKKELKRIGLRGNS